MKMVSYDKFVKILISLDMIRKIAAKFDVEGIFPVSVAVIAKN